MSEKKCTQCGSTKFKNHGMRKYAGILCRRFRCKECGTKAHIPVDDENLIITPRSNTEKQIDIDGAAIYHKTGSSWNKISISPDEALRGNIPEIGLNENLQGLEVTGVTYLKKDADNVLHWVKTKSKHPSSLMLAEFADRLAGKIEPRAEIAVPDFVVDDLLTQYTITDLHVGMYSWLQETGADWDLQICYDTVSKAIDLSMATSPHSKTGLFLQLGDFFHYDGHAAVTPTSGNLLDADGRFSKMLDVGEDIMIETIDKLLGKHEIVKVIVAQGNHDLSTSDTLRSLIRRYYKRNARVDVIGSANPFYALEHGLTMVGAHHGHLKKKVNLASHFSQFFAPIWGRTKFRYLHCGHLHCHNEFEKDGALTMQHTTIAAPDAYAAHRFDKTYRSINSITYSDKYGMIQRNIIPIEMAEAE